MILMSYGVCLGLVQDGYMANTKRIETTGTAATALGMTPADHRAIKVRIADRSERKGDMIETRRALARDLRAMAFRAARRVRATGDRSIKDLSDVMAAAAGNLEATTVHPTERFWIG